MTIRAVWDRTGTGVRHEIKIVLISQKRPSSNHRYYSKNVLWSLSKPKSNRKLSSTKILHYLPYIRALYVECCAYSTIWYTWKLNAIRSQALRSKFTNSCKGACKDIGFSVILVDSHTHSFNVLKMYSSLRTCALSYLHVLNEWHNVDGW